MSLARVSVLTTIYQVLGLVAAMAVQVILAAQFGMSGSMDAYVAAMVLPSTFSVVLSTALYRGGLPLLIDWQATPRYQEVTSGLFNWIVVALGVVALAMAVWADGLVGCLAPGLDGPTSVTAVRLFRWLTLTVWAGGVSAWLSNLYYAEGRFVPPTFGPLVQSLVTIAAVMGLSHRLGIVSVAIGSSLGAVAQVVFLAPALVRGGRYRWAWSSVVPQLTRLASLAGPLAAGAIFYKLTTVLEKTVASFLPPGSMAALGYAFKPIPLLLAVVTSGFATVIFPLNSQLASSGLHEQLRRSMEHAFALLAIAVTPVAVGLWLFRVPLVALLFERGHFTGADTLVTASLMGWYAVAFWFMAVSTVPSQIYGIVQRTAVLIPIGIGQTIAYLLYARWLAFHAGMLGLAGACAVYYLISWGINMVVCLQWIPELRPWTFLHRPLLIALVGVVIGFLLQHSPAVPAQTSAMISWGATAGQAILFLGLYGAVVWALLRGRALTDLWRWWRGSSVGQRPIVVEPVPTTQTVLHAGAR